MAQAKRQEKQNASAKRSPVITVDYGRYARFLSDENDMSDEEKLQFTQALWAIMLQLAVYGFRFEPEISEQTACGQPPESHKNSSPSVSDTVEYSRQKISTEFKTASTSESTLAVEGAGP